MNRKQVIESQGATCRNWTWSWSFINESKKIIIFGAWDVNQSGNKSLILSGEWEISRKGRKQPGYAQSKEHIRLVEKEGYRLMTFPMVYSGAYEEGPGPAKIESFTPMLASKSLIRVGSCWYASDDAVSTSIAEEVSNPERFVEGAAKTIAVNAYERNSKARSACIKHYGVICAVCNFNFEAAYGAIGKGFIHVHHIVPLAEIRQEYEFDPIRDLVPVCPNCHAIIRLTQPPMRIEELRSCLATSRNA